MTPRSLPLIVLAFLCLTNTYILGLTPSAEGVSPSIYVPAPERECVVLVHGLGRTRASMWCLGRTLEKQGFEVRSIGYPSRRGRADWLVAHYLEPAWRQILAEKWTRVHVVGHSLGGLLMRQVLADTPDTPPGRLVLLASPSRGSELADYLAGLDFYRWVMGPVLTELGTGSQDLAARLPPVERPTLVVAGSRSLNPWFSSKVDGNDDGKVGVEETHVPGETAHRVVNASHTWLMNRPRVQRDISMFLRKGVDETWSNEKGKEGG